MRVQGGPAAILGVVAAAALVGGIAYGVQTIGAGGEPNANPSSSPSAANLVGRDDFCNLMDEMAVAKEQMNRFADETFPSTGEDGVSEDDALEAIREDGQARADLAAEIAGYLRRGAQFVTDAEIVDAFTAVAEGTAAWGATVGITAMQATSVDEYASTLEAALADPDLGAILGAGDAADPIVTQYVFDTCSHDGSDPEPDPETIAQDFCGLVDEMVAYEDEYMTHGVYRFIADFNAGKIPGDDPEFLDAIHAWGRFELDEIETRASYADRLAELAPDPDLVADFEHIAMETRLSDEKFGRVALDATSAEEYLEAKTALLSDPELLALSAESALVADRVGEYIYRTCGLSRFGGGDSLIDLADDDAQMIGEAIEAYFVGWSLGDPLPFITASDGSYYLNDALIGPQSPYVTISAQGPVDPWNWCIELVSDGAPMPWSYSAESGLEFGWCS